MVQEDRKFHKPTSVLGWLGLWSREGLSEPEAVGLLVLHLYAVQSLSGTEEEKVRLKQMLAEIAETYSATSPIISKAAKEALAGMVA